MESTNCPSFRIALYTYMGLALPTVLLMILGAAMGGATPNIPEWTEGYEQNAASGVLAAMMHPAGGFGRFVTVVLAVSIHPPEARQHHLTLCSSVWLATFLRLCTPLPSISRCSYLGCSVSLAISSLSS